MRKSWGFKNNKYLTNKSQRLDRRKYQQIQADLITNDNDLPPFPTTPEEEKDFTGEPYKTYSGQPYEIKQEGEGLAYASKIMGIVSIVLCCFPLINFTCSGLGLAFGIIAKNKGCTKHTLAGIILCSIGLALDLFGTIFGLVLVFKN